MRRTKRTKGFTQAEEVTLKADPGERWVRISRSPHVPDEVDDLLFGFVRQGDTFALSGVVVRTVDSTTGTLLRELPIGRLEDDARNAAESLFGGRPPRVTAHPGAGRAGHGEDFLGQILELHRYAADHHPRRPVTWMHEEGLPKHLRPKDVKTVSTWVQKALALESGANR